MMSSRQSQHLNHGTAKNSNLPPTSSLLHKSPQIVVLQSHIMTPWTKAQIALRNAHISRFYAPYFGHLTSGSPEYIQLARSGFVWDKIHNLRNIAPWRAAESKLSSQLKDIDLIRKDVDLRRSIACPQLAQDTTPASSFNFADFASKSCEIEHNHLTADDAAKMHRLLPEIPHHSSPLQTALGIVLPSPESLAKSLRICPSRSQELLELRNQLIALKAILSLPFFGAN